LLQYLQEILCGDKLLANIYEIISRDHARSPSETLSLTAIPLILADEINKKNGGQAKKINPLDILVIICINKNMQRIHIWVSGVVQGVGFRYFAVRKGRELGVTGWVKNTPDGKVEVVAEGVEWQLEELTGDLKVGPSSSSVSGIEVEEEKYQNEFDEFEVRF